MDQKDSRKYEIVINKIREMIIHGDLKQGDRIPPERELAERFNVSRAPIREAIKILEYIGILDSSQGDGTYVRNVTMDDIAKKLQFSIAITKDSLMDLMDLRIALESFAAKQAALNHTEEDLLAMKNNIDEVLYYKKQASQDETSIEHFKALSHEFHRIIIRAAHNSILSIIYDSLYNLLDISKQVTTSVSGTSYSSILGHEAIYHYIAYSEDTGAYEAMEKHLFDVREKLKESLSDIQPVPVSPFK